MTESRVTGVRHIALAVPDYDREVDFYEQLWGLKKVDHDRGVAFLAAEGSPEQYVIRFGAAKSDALTCLLSASPI